MKNKIKYIIPILIFIISIICLVLLIIYNYSIWLNEYNEQINKLGFYENDIILLNQEYEKIFIVSGISLSIFGILGSIIAFGVMLIGE